METAAEPVCGQGIPRRLLVLLHPWCLVCTWDLHRKNVWPYHWNATWSFTVQQNLFTLVPGPASGRPSGLSEPFPGDELHSHGGGGVGSLPLLRVHSSRLVRGWGFALTCKGGCRTLQGLGVELWRGRAEKRKFLIWDAQREPDSDSGSGSAHPPVHQQTPTTASGEDLVSPSRTPCAWQEPNHGSHPPASQDCH